MQILDSEWLIKMLAKSGLTPEARMLSLFEILSDWLDAPQIHAVIKQENIDHHQPQLLLNYLSTQAQEAGAAMPNMLAEQLIFLASSALKNHLEDAQSTSLHHAKHAAQALIEAQCESESMQINKSTLYSALAVFVSIIVIGALFYSHQPSAVAQPAIASSMFQSSNPQPSDNQPAIAGNPKQTADMYASIETMRGGDCQYMEALQIPDADKKIYLENVVGGQVPTNAHDQMIAEHYMQKIRCNYKPMLMKDSTN